MSKKIIILGPPGTGKTTLRKIFFEGENASRLLEYALEPTKGQECITLELNEKIGIFDLAGQENQFWFETNKDSVFHDVKIIIIVIDVLMPIEEILKFINKVLKIRNDISPKSIVYLLIHKIDLIDVKKISEIKDIIRNTFSNENFLKIRFTSIHKKYFDKTFLLFIDILKTCVSQELAAEKMDLDIFANIINFLYLINQHSSISGAEIIEKLKLSEHIFTQIVGLFKSKGLIKTTIINGSEIFSLSETGNKYFDKILTTFTVEDSNKTALDSITSISFELESLPPFIGFIMGDKAGKTLIVVEIEDNALKKFINPSNKSGTIEIDLIHMFISALEIFSNQLNIKDLPGFDLKGTNIKVHTFNFELLTVTLFMKHDTNIKLFKSYIHIWLDKLITKYQKKMTITIRTGDLSYMSEIKREGIVWLKELNEKYKLMAFNVEFFEIKQAQVLYEKLEHIQIKKNENSQNLEKRVKKWKMELIKASLEEDYKTIKQISEKVTQYLQEM